MGLNWCGEKGAVYWSAGKLAGSQSQTDQAEYERTKSALIAPYLPLLASLPANQWPTCLTS
jgi:hypothetical protein